jgi:hypothetical protein
MTTNPAYDLLLTGAITLFLSGFVTLWLWQTNKHTGSIKGPLKRAYAIVRMVKYGKVPTLCNAHAVELIKRKGKMALIDCFNCEICTKRSKLI